MKGESKIFVLSSYKTILENNQIIDNRKYLLKECQLINEKKIIEYPIL